MSAVSNPSSGKEWEIDGHSFNPPLGLSVTESPTFFPVFLFFKPWGSVTLWPSSVPTIGLRGTGSQLTRDPRDSEMEEG